MVLMVTYPLVNIQKAIENGPFSSWIYPLKMVIFHSYVSLPEGILTNYMVKGGYGREKNGGKSCGNMIN